MLGPIAVLIFFAKPYSGNATCSLYSDFMALSSAQTSGRGSAGTPTQREHELQKENLKLSSENLELRFQLEQANKDLPRLKVRPKKSPEIHLG